jgi:hypothetical protein
MKEISNIGGKDLFRLGEIVVTTNCAGELEERFGENWQNAAFVLVNKHVRGDYGGLLCEDDINANTHAIATGERILSKYHIPCLSDDIYIITEWDRSYTTVMLCGDY